MTNCADSTRDEWSQALCLLTSLTAAPAMTVVVRVRVANAVVDQVGAGRRVMNGVRPVDVRGRPIGGVTGGRTVVLGARQIARDNGVARC